MARKKRKKLRWPKRRLIAAPFVLLGLYLLFELVTWPNVAALARERPESTAFIERYKAKSGKSRIAQVWVPYDRIALGLKHAVLAGEDIGFLGHDGFATEEMKDAVKDAVLEGKKLRGASTITQQLAKNLWLSASRNPLRKVKEAILTRQLENDLSKKRILEIYLNVVELGPGVFGVEAAAQHWFHTSASALSDDQAIALAAMLPSPRKWHPGSDNERYRRQAEAIRRRVGRSMWLREKL
jgi:monofunctional glycosyltransferase